ncbi:MAG: hypothetical protein IJJ04_04225 [Clostridia bacterium]|nr:hypothetical protein [Clostridia bacterium]
MKSHKSKKIISKIIFILSPLFLTANTFAMKPNKPHTHIQSETSKNQASQTELKSPTKKATINYNHRKKLSYLNELAVHEANKSAKTDLKPTQISIRSDGCITKRYETKNYIITDILTKNGINIIKKAKKNSTPKTSAPTYGPYKNDPYNESDDEWENNEYTKNILHLKMTHHPHDYFKIRILSNKIDFIHKTMDYSLPEKYAFYAWTLFLDDKNNPSAFLKYVLNTGSLIQHLKTMEDELFYDSPLCCNMFIMDNRIKLSKPLNFPKSEWSKRQKNLNYIIYVKKDFLQNLTPDEWSEITFYIPFKAINSQ